MSDIMHPLSLGEYLTWIFDEHKKRESVFGIPDALFFDPESNKNLSLNKFGKKLETPIGVAAGPHSQLSHNIVSAWLTGARFIELKTVQILDELEVTKPCIDMQDVGYNCEWSQELKINKSFEEYLKAWILIHVLKKRFGHEQDADNAGTIFNISVGYNLEGIKSDSVQRFLSLMRDSSKERDQMISGLSSSLNVVNDLDVPSMISDNVTLSTMHGCPPEEIERIALFLIEEMGLHTTVKFNPTLLGPQLLREILNGDLGYTDIDVPDEAFEHDPSFDDALSIINSLSSAAEKQGVDFGIKLSNTLETRNVRLSLPENEKFHYMSGRALHPLTVNLAHRLSEKLNGEISISFAAGADAFNLPNLIACGFCPVTVSSDLLKPGGYGRLAQYVENLSLAMRAGKATSLDEYMSVDAERLAGYADEVRNDERYHAKRIPLSTKTAVPLDLFDCIAAPCRAGCPTYQNVPDYLYLVSHDRVDDAMKVVLNENPMPGVTGNVCDHPCTAKCVRSNYDHPVLIREVKRYIAEKGQSDSTLIKLPENGIRAAVMGAGPAGISCAYYLALHGFKTSVFDSKDASGGIPAAIIPPYRLTDATVERDINAVSELGVEFVFNCELGKKGGKAESRKSKIEIRNPRHSSGRKRLKAERGDGESLPANGANKREWERGEGYGFEQEAAEKTEGENNHEWENIISIDDLHEDGFKYIFIGVGAEKGRRLNIEGEAGSGVYDCMEFLRQVRADVPPDLGKRVIVIGGGNSAMDAARTAWRLTGDEGTVTVVYRRTVAQMPAEQEEIEELFKEGIEVRELYSPKRIIRKENGKLLGMECQRNKLGEKDSSGRARPEPIPNAIDMIEADAIIVAVSQSADVAYLEEFGIKFQKNGNIFTDANMMTSRADIFAGGDAVRGASTIITAIADGRAVASEICRREGVDFLEEKYLQKEGSRNDYLVRRSTRKYPVKTSCPPIENRNMNTMVNLPLTGDQAREEAKRCLDCDEFCGLCQTVCPNRANLIYEVTPVSLNLDKYEFQNRRLEKTGTISFSIEQQSQIVNIAEFCNECGNCQTFCPTAGAPYKDKPRLCLTQKVFEEEETKAYRLETDDNGWSFAARDGNDYVRLNVSENCIEYISGKVIVRFDLKLNVQEIKAGPDIREGDRIALEGCAELYVMGKGLVESAGYLSV